MSLKSLIRIAEGYLKKHPVPSDISLFGNLLRLSYIYSTPYTNSKNKEEMLLPLSDIPTKKMQKLSSHSLNFDEKNNRLEHNNSFESIATEQFHEKVLQDDVFGKAKLSKNGNRWVYVAKEKAKKTKSLFLGGKGKAEFEHDFGETYDDITNVGIFVWDISLKKIIQVKMEIENCSKKFIPACPVFADDQGTKIIFHAYTKTQFGHGLLHCFNRPISIFETSIEKQGQQFKQKTKELINKNKTNIFPNISTCYNYLVYFGGEGITHTYALNLFIYERTEQNEWKQLHKIENAAVGYYDILKIYPFEQDKQAYIFYQTLNNGVQKIIKTHLESGKTEEAIKGNTGQSFSIINVHHEQNITLGKIATYNHQSFFYLENHSKLNILQPRNSQQFTLHEYQEPIHGYYLEAKEDEEFKKKKKPLLVLIHGGPHGSIDPNLTMFKYMLLKCGYAILMPNFSGSAGFGEERLNKALGNIGNVDGEQIISLLQKVLKERPYLDAEKVHVYGGSYGGFMSAKMGSKYHKYFKSAIILNGVLSIPANLWFTDIPQWNTVETLKTQSLHELSESDYAAMYKQSPISQSMKIPTLQFLGAKDRRVPYKQGLLFDAITRKIGTPIETYVYENSAHSLSDSVETSMDVILKSMMFLEGIKGQE